ncbi:asparaginase domain-containing protein [Candidatus Saccharibacteria bacterium]|nr:asparaginase domain-containing protein [Candidatus Saccharibacteria bacterium]
MAIKIFLTGGTIDKHYVDTKEVFDFAETHINALLRQGRSTVPTEIEQLMLVDNNDMTDEGRAKILAACQNELSDKIIIVHGTSTMTETGEILGRSDMSSKTIVLVGAEIPAELTHSDASFNLGAAVSAVQLLDSGVYIVMNGQIFSWNNVKKDTERYQFVATE